MSRFPRCFRIPQLQGMEVALERCPLLLPHPLTLTVPTIELATPSDRRLSLLDISRLFSWFLPLSNSAIRSTKYHSDKFTSMITT